MLSERRFISICASLQQLGSECVGYMSSKRASQDCSVSFPGVQCCFLTGIHFLWHEASLPSESRFLHGSFCEVWIKCAGYSSLLENKGFANPVLGVLLLTSVERSLSGKLHPVVLFLRIPALLLQFLSSSLVLYWNIHPRKNCVDCFREIPRPCMYTAEMQWEKIKKSLQLGQ